MSHCGVKNRGIIENKHDATYDIRLILPADADNEKSYVIKLKKEKRSFIADFL